MSLPTTLDDRRTAAGPTGIAARAVDASKVYGKGQTAVRALDHVSVDIPAGRFTAVMGPSGSGKSTLMHCLAGLDELTSGQVFVGDVELGSLSDGALTRLRRDRLGFVFQSFNLIPTLTAEENIVLPLRLAGRSPDRAWVDQVIATVSLQDRLRHRPSELSGGQQQRVAVARALSSQPHVVFADEPTGNLDSRSGAEVLRLLRESVDRLGQTVVMVTHDPTAAAWADQALFLADGRIVGRLDDPTAATVLEQMKDLGAEMLRTTLKAAWSRKRRLVGTALAIVLGVGFLTATLVLGDSARAGFEVAFTEANAGTDAIVRSDARLTGGESTVGTPIDASMLEEVLAVDGVEAVAPSVEGFGQILDAEGDPIGGDGPPTMAANWVEDAELTGWEIADGRAPSTPDEVVIDRGSATEAGASVGDRVTILLPAPTERTVAGIATFGDDDSIGGSTLVAFETEEAQRVLLGSTDRISAVVVAAVAGVSQDELVDRLDAALPGELDVLSGADLTAEMEEEIEGDFLGALTTALLAFALVALLVAGFSIFNTFSILVAQRTRESALLRALGASRTQVLGSALLESTIVGLIGAVGGVLVGIGLAAGMLALMEGAGFGLPTDGLALSSGTAVSAVVVGLLVTVLGGLVPAWKSSRVAPLAALRDVAIDDAASSRIRAVLGGLLSVVGAAVMLLATRAEEGGVGTAGLGAVALFIGVILLGPIVVPSVGRVLGSPLKLKGVTGDLARRNAVRNPRRTSGTAAALLVGVGIVTLFTVFGASVSQSISDEVDRSFGGDLVLSPRGSGFSGAGVSTDVQSALADLPEVAAVAGVGFGPATVDGEQEEVDFSDASAIASILSFEQVDGDLTDVGDDELAMSADFAEGRWEVGDPVEIGYADGATETMTLAAVYEDQALGGNIVVPLAAWEAHNPQSSFFAVFVDLADGVPLADGRAAVEAALPAEGTPDILDRDEFVEAEVAEIDVLLTVIYGLLLIAIVIALMGIANTLSLSVHERTRELGLLRAVGQTRSQLRSMVRWESVLVATFGSVGGLALGTFLGWGLVRTLNATEGFGSFALPVGSMVVVLVVGAVAGVLAGLRPAWRASRLDVLAAVSAD